MGILPSSVKGTAAVRCRAHSTVHPGATTAPQSGRQRAITRVPRHPATGVEPHSLQQPVAMQPDGSQHCIQFWRTGSCQWTGRCRFPHQCYVCGSPAHGTAQHSMMGGGGGGPPPYGAPPPPHHGGYGGYPPSGGYGDHGYGYGGGYGGPPSGGGYGRDPYGHHGQGHSPAVPGGVAPPSGAPAAGDWQCTSCGWGNYPERQSCRKCHAPRPAQASAALASAGANISAPDGKQHCIQFWRTGTCQWVGRCRFPHQCLMCGSTEHGTGQHASMAVATSGGGAGAGGEAHAAEGAAGGSSGAAAGGSPSPYAEAAAAGLAAGAAAAAAGQQAAAAPDADADPLAEAAAAEAAAAEAQAAADPQPAADPEAAAAPNGDAAAEEPQRGRSPVRAAGERDRSSSPAEKTGEEKAARSRSRSPVKPSA